MTTRHPFTALISLIITLLFAVHQAAADHVAPGDQLIATSGFASLAIQLPQHFYRGISDAADFEKPAAANKVELLNSAEAAFKQADIQHQIALAVSRALSEQDIQQLMQWYQSPTGKKISQAQAHAASEEGFSAMMAPVNNLLDQEQLLELAQVMDKQLNFVEFIVDLQEYQAFAEYSAVRSFRQQALNIDGFNERMKRRRNEMKFNAEQLVMISLAYAFRNVSAADIQAYEHFLQQPLTQLYLKAAMRGLEVGKQQMVKHWLDNVDLHIASE